MNKRPLNPASTGLIDIEAKEEAEVLAKLSAHLQTLTPAPSVLGSLEKRLNTRVTAIIAQHAGLFTVRSSSGTWRQLVSGIRYKPLWESRSGNSILADFAPGAFLPVHRHTYAEEGIVLSGSLQVDDLVLNQFDYHFSPAGSHHGRIRSKEGAVVFLHGSSVGHSLSMLKELAGGLLPKNKKTSSSIQAKKGEWIEVQPGLFEKELWSDGIISSKFFRLEPGTGLKGHGHPLDEECMMLSGDIFLGDILLQTGDYHFAPKGSRHLDIYTDTGALLYVRGAAG